MYLIVKEVFFIQVLQIPFLSTHILMVAKHTDQRQLSNRVKTRKQSNAITWDKAPIATDTASIPSWPAVTSFCLTPIRREPQQRGVQSPTGVTRRATAANFDAEATLPARSKPFNA